jgi:hypothetical protein
MWCDKCHYGSAYMKRPVTGKCPQGCGGTKFVTKSPFPSPGTRTLSGKGGKVIHKDPEVEVATQ